MGLLPSVLRAALLRSRHPYTNGQPEIDIATNKNLPDRARPGRLR